MQLIKDLGFSAINAQGMTVAPYVVGWFMVVFQAWHSDYTKDRGYHAMGSCTSFSPRLRKRAAERRTLHSSSSLEAITADHVCHLIKNSLGKTLIDYSRSWAANCFSPTSKRGVGTSFIVSISNTVSI
jgi:hypothetical protein